MNWLRLNIAVLLFGSLMTAQFTSGPRMPATEEEKDSMVKHVKELTVPRAEFAYQASQDAQRQAEAYATIRTSNEGFVKSLSDYKSEYQRSSDEVKKKWKACNDQSAKDLQSRLNDMAPLEPMLTVSAKAYADYFAEIQRLSQLEPSEACKALKDDAEWKSLSEKFDAGLQAASVIASNNAKWAAALADVWGERAAMLDKQSAKGVVNKLSQNLWQLVLLLALFAGGLLLLMKFYSHDIQFELVTSGQIIQLPTVMLLLVTILVLGLGDKIQENTIGTLLGGLAGYVLAQGVGRAAARSATALARSGTPSDPTTPHEETTDQHIVAKNGETKADKDQPGKGQADRQ